MPRSSGTSMRWCFLVMVLAGCGSATNPTPRTRVASITVTPVTDRLPVGNHLTLVAVARDTAGTILLGQSLSWTSDDPAVATVGSDGVVLAVAPGSARITVAADEASATASIEVGAARIARLEVTPSTVALHAGATRQILITPLDSAGDALENRTVTWAVTDPGVATVSGNGLVTAVANGQTAISATVEDSVTHIGVTVSDATTNLAVASVEVIQIAQDTLNSIPLLAGKPTLVRVWVTGNPSTQASRPVALELFRHDVLDTTLVGMTAPTLPPGRTDELATSVNFLLPASIDLRDVSLRAIVDPDGELAEADEFDNRWPRDHRLVLGAPVQLPPLRATFVPVALQEGLGSITLGPEDVARYDTAFRRMLPVVSTSLATHEQLSVQVHTDPVRPGQALMEAVGLDILRVQTAEAAADRSYYGLVPQLRYQGSQVLTWNHGGQGGGHLAVWIHQGGEYWSSTAERATHEVGHTLSLLHAPCNVTIDLDPDYPYPDGNIGVWGYDAGTDHGFAPRTPDVMSYCSVAGGLWISDYNFRRALAFRILSERVPTAAAHTGGPGLLISGQLRNDGSIDVQPVFPLDRAVPAAVTHPNGRIEGLDADGVVLFSAPLESQQVTDGPEGAAMFAVAVSAAPAIQDRLARLRVTVAGHQVVVSGTGAAALRESPVVALRTEGSSRVLTWSAGSYPGVMVRDRSTGEVVGFGSNGVLRLPRSGHLLDVIVSDGLHGRAVPVQP